MHSNGSQAEISSRNAAITKYNVESLYAKKYKKKEKNLENAKEVLYTKKAVTLIAVKREVAACGMGVDQNICRFSVERMSS